MAISALRGRGAKTSTTPKRNRSRRANQPAHSDYENLTVGALYDLAQHGAITASGALQGSALYVEKRNAQDIRRLIQPWQARCMSYYDLVPEVKFATSFFSQMLRQVRLYPAMVDPKTHEPEEIDSGPIFDAFNRIHDRTGGRSELQASYAKLRFLIGECYLTASPDETWGEIWECLSPNELRVQPGGYASRFRAPMLSADQYIIGNDQAHLAEYGEPLGPAFAEQGPDIITVYRLWRGHPAYSMLADCNMQAAVDILEELVLSTYSVRAQLKSRLNQAGVLWVPDEISFASIGNDPDEDSGTDLFQQRLQQAIMAAISDPGSAAAVSPIIARVAADYIGKIQYTRFNDSQGELAEITQRTEMIGRYATCIELPKEVITGTADINHWGAWLIDQQTYDSYGKPVANEMASDLCAAYLQPTAKEEGIAGWENITIGVDAAGAINHPDSAKDATTLYQARAIGKKVYREKLGYNDNDAMPEDELNEAIGVAIRDGSYAKYGIPSVRANIEPAAGDIASTTGEVDSNVVAPAPGSDSEQGPPPGGPGAAAGQGGPALQASAASDREQRILGAADFAIQRGRELAGQRLRAWTSSRGPRDVRCQECQEKIDGVPNWDVAAILGHETVTTLAMSPSLKTTGGGNLVDGVGQAFAAVAERLGVTPAWATELGELVEQHTARTLYDVVPEPMPDAFRRLLARIYVPLEPA